MPDPNLDLYDFCAKIHLNGSNVRMMILSLLSECINNSWQNPSVMLYGAKRDHQYHGYVQTITTPMEESRQEFLAAPNICKS